MFICPSWTNQVTTQAILRQSENSRQCTQTLYRFIAHSGTTVEIQHYVRRSLSPGPVLPVVGCMFRTDALRDPCTAVDTFYSDISVPQSWTS